MRLALTVLIPLAAAALPAVAQEGAPPPYTAEQAARGAEAYIDTCQVCHGADLAGGPFAPSISGASFKRQWGGKSAADLFVYLRAGMPPGQAESIAPEDHADIMAHVLAVNGLPAGKVELAADAAKLKGYVLPR